MDPFATSHFSHQDLLRDLKAQDARNRASTAVLLSRIAEVDDRRLYRDEGYPSMYEYLVGELHYSDGMAYRRLNAARTARRFPAIFVALMEGRVHLRAVLMLAPHLTSGNADDLLAAATHKTRVELEQILARRFPRPDLVERLVAIAPPAGTSGPSAPSPAAQLTPEQAAAAGPGPDTHEHLGPRPAPQAELAPDRVDAAIPDQDGRGEQVPPMPAVARQLTPEQAAPVAPRPRVMALSAQRFGLQVTIEQGTYEKLQRARELLGHRLPAGEIAAVLDRALDALIAALEKDRFAATSRPWAGGPHSSTNPRHIPAEVKRTVRERDGGQCTFVSERGQRCTARARLEFDHIEPIARGGKSTVENLHLVCSAHNQLLAERTFGAGFMHEKREAVRHAAAARA